MTLASRYLYERCLHHVLVAALGEAAAAEGLSSIEDLSPDKRDRVVACIVGREEEQKGLINAAVEVVAFAHMVAPAEESFPAATLRMGRERHCTELLLGIRWMVNALKASAAHGVAGMPGEVTQYLELVQQRVLEELLFVPGSSLFSRIQSFIKSKMKGDDVDADTGIDGIVLDTTLSRVMTMVAERTACLCAALCQVTGLAAHQGGEFIAQALGDATSTLLLNLLGAHLDMLFGQHITAIVLAGIFCTARMHGLSLKFRLLTEVATSCSPCHDATVFEGISLRPVHTGTLLAAHMADGAQQNGSGDLLSSTQDDSLEEAPGVGSGPVGSVREYYNTVFLSLVQLHTKESLFGVTSAALEAAIEAAPFPVTLVAVHGGGKGPQGVSKAAKVGQAEDAGQAGRSKAHKPRVREPLGDMANARAKGEA